MTFGSLTDFLIQLNQTERDGEFFHFFFSSIKECAKNSRTIAAPHENTFFPLTTGMMINGSYNKCIIGRYATSKRKFVVIFFNNYSIDDYRKSNLFTFFHPQKKNKK